MARGWTKKIQPSPLKSLQILYLAAFRPDASGYPPSAIPIHNARFLHIHPQFPDALTGLRFLRSSSSCHKAFVYRSFWLLFFHKHAPSDCLAVKRVPLFSPVCRSLQSILAFLQNLIEKLVCRSRSHFAGQPFATAFPIHSVSTMRAPVLMTLSATGISPSAPLLYRCFL